MNDKTIQNENGDGIHWTLLGRNSAIAGADNSFVENRWARSKRRSRRSGGCDESASPSTKEDIAQTGTTKLLIYSYPHVQRHGLEAFILQRLAKGEVGGFLKFVPAIEPEQTL